MITEIKNFVANNEMYFWCNSLGELHLPGDTLKEFPHKVAGIYEKHWEEDNPARYVVTYHGQVGLLLAALYDEDYVGELMGYGDVEEIPSAVMKEAYLIIMGYATTLSRKFDPSCTLFTGNYSACGHELWLFIPADIGDAAIEKAIQEFKKTAYLKCSKYLVAVHGQYVRNAEILGGNVEQYTAQDVSDNDSIWELAENHSLVLGEYQAVKKEYAIEQCIRDYKGQYRLHPNALVAYKLK